MMPKHKIIIKGAFLEQGSPQDKFKAQWVGVVQVEFVTTSIILATKSKK